MTFATLIRNVSEHIALYKEGKAMCPRTFNMHAPRNEFDEEYIVEWDRQMLLQRKEIFSTIAE